ncbi:helix-turn-helix domain-containing protein, partial [Arthrobacter sp. YAF17]
MEAGSGRISPPRTAHQGRAATRERGGLRMPKRTEQVTEEPAPTTVPGFPRMLTLEQVQEVLNVKSALVYSLVRSGELPAGQFGGRGVWRVRESDLA